MITDSKTEPTWESEFTPENIQNIMEDMYYQVQRAKKQICEQCIEAAVNHRTEIRYVFSDSRAAPLIDKWLQDKGFKTKMMIIASSEKPIVCYVDISWRKNAR